MRTMEKKGRPSAPQVPFCVAGVCRGAAWKGQNALVISFPSSVLHWESWLLASLLPVTASLRKRLFLLEVSTPRSQYAREKEKVGHRRTDSPGIVPRAVSAAAAAYSQAGVRHFPSPPPSSNIYRHPRVAPHPPARSPHTPRLCVSLLYLLRPLAMPLSVSVLTSPWHKLRSKAKRLARKSTNR